MKHKNKNVREYIGDDGELLIPFDDSPDYLDRQSIYTAVKHKKHTLKLYETLDWPNTGQDIQFTMVRHHVTDSKDQANLLDLEKGPKLTLDWVIFLIVLFTVTGMFCAFLMIITSA